MKIAIDLDMTLVDHTEYYKNIFKKYKTKFYPTAYWTLADYPEDIRKEVFKDFTDPECRAVTTYTPIKKSISTLYTLKDRGYEIDIVTSRVKSKKNEEYVRRLFPMVDKVHILGLDAKKYEFINKKHYDLWIDDYPKGYNETKCDIILISNKYTKYNWDFRKELDYVKRIDKVLLYL